MVVSFGKKIAYLVSILYTEKSNDIFIILTNITKYFKETINSVNYKLAKPYIDYINIYNASLYNQNQYR